MEKCSKCKEELTGWWNQWPNFARIEIGVSSRMTDHLKIPYNHSLVKEFQEQKVVLEYGAGFKIPKSEYRLCCKCQNELVELIGDFFNTTK